MKEFPLNKAFTLLEPGPVILVTTNDGNNTNMMTLSWTMVLDFTSRFAFMTGSWNYSYKALTKTKECVIAVPTVDLARTVVRIGSCSGANVNKFEKFKLTPVNAVHVNAPLVKECYANIECRVVDHIQKYNIFILDGIAAWVDEKRREKRFFHAVGDGRFIVDGEKINHRKIMIEKLPNGV
ncbi:MAG: flavin reductase family protein [Planctomycetaceae bacterium]|jgi:flavin reductase (DIM6/NTAB) family NADH-FMN oxidoreductase RutF|nr:flavin reductase family protein [Planctomycetaceae bacterium]